MKKKTHLSCSLHKGNVLPKNFKKDKKEVIFTFNVSWRHIFVIAVETRGKVTSNFCDNKEVYILFKKEHGKIVSLQ